MSTTTRNVVIVIAIIALVVFALPLLFSIVALFLSPAAFGPGAPFFDSPFDGRFPMAFGRVGAVLAFVMVLAMGVFWIAVIAGIILLIRWAVSGGASPRTPAGRSEALDILQRRYAAGEITREEYEEKRRDILGT